LRSSVRSPRPAERRGFRQFDHQRWSSHALPAEADAPAIARRTRAHPGSRRQWRRPPAKDRAEPQFQPVHEPGGKAELAREQRPRLEERRNCRAGNHGEQDANRHGQHGDGKACHADQSPPRLRARTGRS
jgi:hypothetical protein